MRRGRSTVGVRSDGLRKEDCFGVMFTYVFPFFVVVPEHRGTFTAEASDTVDSFLRCAVFVEFKYRLIFPRTISW
jgi:hypothetical protein